MPLPNSPFREDLLRCRPSARGMRVWAPGKPVANLVYDGLDALPAPRPRVGRHGRRRRSRHARLPGDGAGEARVRRGDTGHLPGGTWPSATPATPPPAARAGRTPSRRPRPTPPAAGSRSPTTATCPTPPRRRAPNSCGIAPWLAGSAPRHQRRRRDRRAPGPGRRPTCRWRRPWPAPCPRLEALTAPAAPGGVGPARGLCTAWFTGGDPIPMPDAAVADLRPSAATQPTTLPLPNP